MKSCYELFGIECGKGWASLYEPLIKLCRDNNVTIIQIKEKYGTLHFYVGAAPDLIYEAIDTAEHRSKTMCEQCGKAGKLRTDRGWYQTLCDEHAAEPESPENSLP